MRSSIFATLIGVISALSLPAIAKDIHIGSLSAQDGKHVTGYLDIAAQQDQATRIPVSIIKGLQDGPTLALMAGTHGAEYAPILALQSLADHIDPTTLKGTLILVHIANPSSFYQRTIYFNPVDGKNLNRAFPGNKNGSQSKRIAYVLTTEVIEQADYFVDMHSGDGNEDLRPYIYMPRTENTDLDNEIAGMAQAFGLDHIVIDKSAVTAPDASVFTDMTALSRGIPAMTTEIGGMGSSDARWVNGNIKGALNLMRHLGMIDGEILPENPIIYLEDYQVINAPENGLFEAAVDRGAMVEKGTILGTITSPFGETITPIRAPFKGVINYIVKTPPATKGQPLAMISKLAKE